MVARKRKNQDVSDVNNLYSDKKRQLNFTYFTTMKRKADKLLYESKEKNQ
jgi:hypothetical protein